MALRYIKITTAIRRSYIISRVERSQRNVITSIRNKVSSSTTVLNEESNFRKAKEFKTENDIIYLEDPDTFGTLSRTVKTQNVILEDEGDIEEEEFIKNIPLESQRLTTRQYADLIKQYLKHKRLKEAINVLEIKMLKEDRVKPENYIYNILIGACAEVGYTKKAFKLYNEMKRRALQPTGDTYTCLFQACTNSPWPADGLKLATHLRELLIEKGIEPNITNYNAMIKAFGRCGDLPTAFKLVDEMRSKKIKIRVHTFNHLLQACISDKKSGLKHALVVWRKMLKLREKPNVYSFNLMLKCVKDCNIGSKEDIEFLLQDIQEHIALEGNKVLGIQSSQVMLESGDHKKTKLLESTNHDARTDTDSELNKEKKEMDPDVVKDLDYNELVVHSEDKMPIQILNIESVHKVPQKRLVPNLLSKVLKMDHVLSLKEVNTVQEKFAVIGGQEDFLKEMEVYSVKPDIKTFTQMLPLLENTTEAENKLLDTMKSLEIKADIDFYNMLIKKRCMRSDYNAAFDVKGIIKKENEFRKKRYTLNKKLRLKPNIMTYGVLAMACETKELAEKLINEMKEEQIKINIEILGTLLRQGTANIQFGYVLYIMNIVKEESVPVNDIFLKHLEKFNDYCISEIEKDKNGKHQCSEVFKKAYKIFSYSYNSWLKEVNLEKALKPEHPWAQYHDTYPETVQRQNIEIRQPKKFYKRNKKFVQYAPRT